MINRNEFKKLDARLNRDLRKSNARTWKSYQDRIAELKEYVSGLYAKYGGTFPISAYRNESVARVTSDIASGLYSDLFRDIDDDLRSIFIASFDTTSEILAITGVATAVKLNALDIAMKTPVAGLTIDLRLAGYQDDIAKKLTRSILIGSSQLKTMPEMFAGLDDVFTGNNSFIKRIVATEAHRLTETAKYDSASSDDKKRLKTWVSMGDAVVRDAHNDLDGKTIPIDEEFESTTGGRGMFPGEMGTAEDDINCRCWVVYS